MPVEIRFSTLQETIILYYKSFKKSRNKSVIIIYMPLTLKGRKIMAAMKSQYGGKKGEQVFYASKNKGKIIGVEGKKHIAMKLRSMG